MSITVAPYGSWKSPIQAGQIAQATIGLTGAMADGEDLYWSEMRPTEAGRYVVVRRTPDGTMRDVLPPGFNARTRVNEYGGASFTVAGGVVYFANFADQRVYRYSPADTLPPMPITPDGFRYGDFTFDAARNRLLCVREDHTVGGEPANTIVALPLPDGGAGAVLASGNDFYMAPRLSPDGKKLAYLTWNHPAMPWDAAELRLATLDKTGAITAERSIAGGTHTAVAQPAFSPEGVLYFVSDRTNWWNLYRWRRSRLEQITNLDAEFTPPLWGLGVQTYDFADEHRILAACTQNGLWQLTDIDTHTRVLKTVEIPQSYIASLRIAHGSAYLLGGSSRTATAIVKMELPEGDAAPAQQTLRRCSELAFDAGYLSEPTPLEFPTTGGATAHAIYYRPANKDYTAPAGERPPLLVKIHGGPTSFAPTGLRMDIQYYTSRGIAVLDVNYGGSTGYGREYRQRLNEQWGIVDVDDCCNGAKHLADRGEVDVKRLAITGGSAGGYTTLAAIAFKKVFTAACSRYGVSDCELLAKETHKFESRYLDTLIGPYPQERQRYIDRSPIHHVESIACPVIFFQGLDDKIVPPDQAEILFDALKKKGVPTAYVPFEGEQHGFRQAKNIQRAMEGEFYFFAKVFGFTPADALEPVKIENL